MVSTGTDQSIGMKSYGEKADRKKAGMEQGPRDRTKGCVHASASEANSTIYSRTVGAGGSEIWLSSRWQSTPCCRDRNYSLLRTWRLPMAQFAQLSRSRAHGESLRSDAPCPRRQHRHLENGLPCLTKNVRIIFSWPRRRASSF